ncbi:hypothetical protein E2986_13923 [Frieseomelitta varia]|uniref:Uncharacterized protein n=1 Tax=Frieseomelitta varia TaxID=561572 RepID=A0A833SF08_9HYME|nr:hypothetical protein E2986_13923 [Frieseomelitta varia]
MNEIEKQGNHTSHLKFGILTKKIFSSERTNIKYNTMELKGNNSVKSNRIRSSIKSKKSFIPKVEVVTENVFVPITKTVFTKKCGDAIQCFSVPKVKLVKFYQCNNSTKMSLLKKPCLQEKRYANSIPYPKQDFPNEQSSIF